LWQRPLSAAARLEQGIAAITAAIFAASGKNKFLSWSSVTRAMPALGVADAG
jgi:hypothetical protein